MDYDTRLEHLRGLMADYQLDGIVYGTGANFQYFTGLQQDWNRINEPTLPKSLLLLAFNEEPRIVTETSFEETATELISYFRACFGGRIGVNRSAARYLERLLASAQPSPEVVDGEAPAELVRLRKGPEELELLERVVALTDRVMERVVPHLRPGITQPEVQQLIAEEGRALGAADVSFFPAALFVKSGTEPTKNPFVYPDEEGLVPGTSIAFDFGFVLDGYCSDFGRSFYCGPAPDHISGAYRALQEAQCALIGMMKPGMLLGELFGLLEKELDARGYGDRLRARLPDGTLGHQIGVDLHENPWIRTGCETPLQPGMVMAIEPKLWFPGEYYLRVEDIVAVTEDGARSLTAFDRELFELPLE